MRIEGQALAEKPEKKEENMKKEKVLKVVGYCRVSTDNQKEEGTIDIQRQALREYSEQKGYELPRIFEDNGVSGGLENRQGLAELFNYLEKNNKEVGAVVIFKLDRLARDLYLQEHLIKKLEGLNIKLFSVKEANLDSNDPMRKAFRQFMGIVSELEKAFITMRLSAGRRNKIKNKSLYAGGGIALGYNTKNKDLVVNPEQVETIRLIFGMKRQKKGLREIARALNLEGVGTARGGQWYAGTVKYILANQLYKGIMSYSGVRVERADLRVL